MTFETDLSAVIKTITPRVFPDTAPDGTAAPYVVWQGVGGKTLRLLSNQPSDKRNTLMQVSVWSETRLESLALVRQIEDALCSAGQFICSPEGEPISTKDFDTNLYGSIQRFSIYSSR